MAISSTSDAALLALRPNVPTPLADDADSTPGAFLHRTLRPVLKLQNDVLLQLVADFVRDHHVAFLTRSPAEQLRLTEEVLNRNVKLRYTVIGVMLGVFTQAEHDFYRQHRSEVNRRILELATERVRTQLPALTNLLTEAGEGRG